MLKPHRVRFSLRSLFLVATFIIALVGMSQARRYRILSEANALEAEGAAMGVDINWLDKLWLRKPTEAGITFKQLPSGKYSIGHYTCNEDVALSRGEKLKEQLEAFGIQEIHLFFLDRRNCIISFRSLDMLPSLGGE